MESAARKVERLMRKVAAATLLGAHIGETFEGVVTGAMEKGTFVRLFNPPADGRVVRRRERAWTLATACACASSRPNLSAVS